MPLTNDVVSKIRPVDSFIDQDVLRRFPALARYGRDLGDTPLINVPGPKGGARLFAKCEWDNPSGSVKDRTAFAMVHDLLAQLPGDDLSGHKVLEYSGGNLAIALSLLCQGLGLENTLVFGSYVPDESVKKMRVQGSDAVIIDKDLGFWEVVQHAVRLSDANPDWHFLHQHENDANLRMHEMGTGAEIVTDLAALGLTADSWVASIGTGGTLIGVQRALAAANPALQTFATTPAELPYGTEAPANGLPKFDGSGGLGCGRKQPFVAPEESRITGHVTLGFEETMAAMRLFRELTGEWIGSSAAANWLAASRMASDQDADRVTVMVFPSKPSAGEIEKASAYSLDEVKKLTGLKELV
ncbi:pyridoxal-phosphate dependent enzyme [Aestuariispira insulae]|uniref:Cysteine synthase A n=1 Tax=Aestuariispira insulae TaxID=1461337 RepID=A0A3D9H4V2_9PROT|nr:pyridoxal-phosphate dependent enzyme [Aestuariispira insulae]RED44201.1 cysteine synthase A [Aestuariispira insulae]